MVRHVTHFNGIDPLMTSSLRLALPRVRSFLIVWAIVVGLCLPARADVETLVGHWTFNGSIPDGLEGYGQIKLNQAGPRPPEFPDFSQKSGAVRLDGNSTGVKVLGAGSNSDFQFHNGDSITLEAWVNLERIQPGQIVYVIGKGRSDDKSKFVHGNQNWSLRLTEMEGSVRADFLFCTREDGQKSLWHQWKSEAGFLPNTGWHLIAVTYRFGQPDSIKGWIDGVPTDGTWHQGGKTAAEPVVDTDEVWIGTSMNRRSYSSFIGSISEILVHRTRVDPAILEGKFRRVGAGKVAVAQPEEAPDLGNLPAGKVTYSVGEKLPSHTRWLYEGETWPEETSRWHGDAFVMPRMPARFDDWGIRIEWGSPVLLRIAADVEIPAGKQRFLLRGRGLGRLWIDQQVAVRTKADSVRFVNGRNPIFPPPTAPFPGIRPHGGNMQEEIAEVELPDLPAGKPRRVILELVIGGKGVRTDSGEVCVGLVTADGQSCNLLTPAGVPSISMSNADMKAALDRAEDAVLKHEDRQRRQAAASQAEYWDKRRQIAGEWLKASAGPSIPQGDSHAGKHPIDTFLNQKLDRARELAAQSDPVESQSFHSQVLPILRDHCFRCHGDKEQGGLKLNRRELAIKGGESEVAAIVPGHPESSELISRILEKDEALRMPPTGPGLTAEQTQILEIWIRQGAYWPEFSSQVATLEQAPIISDEAFVRRIYLDLIGIPPTAAETANFLADGTPQKRTQLIDRLLKDDRVADQWMGYWLDVLAENPTLISETLNSTGPFRWFLYDSLRDNKPFDRLVTELIMMRGSVHDGGSAGFALAGENDSPFAAKGQILASAFLGMELQCARCHDSPYHSTTQKDLYSLAAMLSRKPVTVPAGSRVPAAFFEKQSRESLIRVTLKPDESIAPVWPFAHETSVSDSDKLNVLLRNPGDSRERLAFLITSHENERFSQVIVNRIWRQLTGAGIVEPVHDWEGKSASHPELLKWLSREFVRSGYDARQLIRLIVTSDFYQRSAVGQNRAASAELRFFNAPDRRRLSAEQVVDSLHVVTGCDMDSEQLSFDPDGRDLMSRRMTLGQPTRGWMMADLKNERDRPSLALPKARLIADVMEAFGWTGSRQMPQSERESAANVLQPGILANGVLSLSLMKVSVRSSLAELALETESAEHLVQTLFLQILNRPPHPGEADDFLQVLADGFNERKVPVDQIVWPTPLPELPQITWYNHANAEANDIQSEREDRLRRGPDADPRLQPDWRERYEDVIWSLINHSEFVWIP